jgi:hypothetical protein
VIVISFFVAIYAIEKYLRTYHSELPITIYYTPPKDIDIILAGTIYEVETFRMFISLIYYRAGKGYINISATSMQIGIFSKNTDYVLSKKTQ